MIELRYQVLEMNDNTIVATFISATDGVVFMFDPSMKFRYQKMFMKDIVTNKIIRNNYEDV